MHDLKLNTVCEEARCPNIGECWHHGTATFMILGDVCTRACGYCAVPHGKPAELDPAEPGRVAEAVARRWTLAVRRHHLGRSRRPARRRRRHLRGDHPARSGRARPACRSRCSSPTSRDWRPSLAHGARRRAGRAQPQHRDGAAPLPHGARRRPLPAHARAARSRAHATRRASPPRAA